MERRIIIWISDIPVYFLFKGGMNIRDSRITNLIASIVNNVDLQYYYNEGVSKTGSVTITGSKYFERVNANSFQANSLISSYDVNQLYEKAIYVKGVPYQTFEGWQMETFLWKLILIYAFAF